MGDSRLGPEYLQQLNTLLENARLLRILITDGEQRSSLAAVRSLGRAGHRVVVCSSHSKPISAASRFSKAFAQVPDPAVDPDGFVGEVERVVEGEDVDLLLPMTDVSAPLLYDLRERRPDLIVPFPERRAYEILSDKVRLDGMAKSLGVPTPRGLVLEHAPGNADLDDSRSRLVEFVEETGFPLVLKPGHSAVRAERGTIRHGVQHVASWDALRRGLQAYHPSAFPMLIQERISGAGLGAFLLADGGRIVAAFGHKRLREKPPTGGVSVYRESVPLRQDVLEYATQLLAAVSWTGVAMVEFKEDRATTTPYLMEVNGRFWGSLQLAIDAGVDFPRLLVARASGEAEDRAPVARAGIRSRWLWGDLDHLLGIWKMPRGYASLHPELPTRLAATGRFLLPWRPGDHFEVLRFDDPRPFLRESIQWLREALRWD